jgi:DNA-binding GntR family transcriptional regulator
MAATKITVATVKGLRTDWQELQAAVSESTLEVIDKKSKDFHSTIIEAAQNRTLARLLESIRGRIEVSRQLYLKPKGKLTLRRAQLSCQEHLAIIDALEVADADRAEEFMRRHLRALMEEILGEAVRHS